MDNTTQGVQYYVCGYSIFPCRSTHGGGSTDQKKSGVQLGWTITAGPGSGPMMKDDMEVMVETLKYIHWMDNTIEWK